MESPNGDSMLDVVRQELMKSPLPTNVEPCSLDDACVKEVLVSFPLSFAVLHCLQHIGFSGGLVDSARCLFFPCILWP